MSTIPTGGNSTVGEISVPSFVGRARELALVERALSGSASVALLEGEAGIGKSRLVQELLAGSLSGATAPVAVCPPFRHGLTLGPIVDALKLATADPGRLRLSTLAGALCPVFPEWADALPAALEPLEDAAAARHRLFRAFAELMDRLDVHVLVVEDAHWADEVTLEFLLFLVSRQPHAPNLLVTYRPEDVTENSLLRRVTSRLLVGTQRTRLCLEALDVDGTAALVSSMLCGEPLSHDFAVFLHERTDGVPLAVEETVRLLHDRADLARRDGEWVRRNLAEIAVPPTVRDAVLERVGRLSGRARDVMRAMAVLSAPADDLLVGAVANLPAEYARTGLAEAIESGLVQEDSRGMVSFRHAFTCTAIAESVPGPLRRHLHARAGRALERVTPRPVGRLARHFREAGDIAAWTRCAERAANLALASGDGATAVRMLYDLIARADLSARQLLRLTEKLPTSMQAPARQRELASALGRARDAAADDPVLQARVRVELGRLYGVMGKDDAARVEIMRALPHLAHEPDWACRAMLLLGMPHTPDWPAARHHRWLRRAMDTVSSMPPEEHIGHLVDAVLALLKLGERDGWVAANRVPATAQTSRGRWEIVRATINLGDCALRWGRYAEAHQYLSRAAELSDTYQHLRYRSIIESTRLYLDLLTGAWDGLAGRAGALAEDVDAQPNVRLEASLVLALLRCATVGDATVAEQLQQIAEAAYQRGNYEDYAATAAVLAGLWLDDGRVDSALDATDGPMGVVRRKGIWAWAAEVAPVRTGALVAAGRLDEAADLVVDFAHGMRAGGTPPALAGLATSRAVLLDGQGAYHRAAAAFARAAAAWHRLPRPYEALLARERQGYCLLAGGRTEQGIALLSRVREDMLVLGARPAAQRVAHALGEQGVEARRMWWGGGRQSYGDNLSPRELTVVRLVVEGRTNRDIAERLYLSPKTVAGHVRSAMRKLRVSSRTALAVRVVGDGLVAEGPAVADGP